MLRSAGPKVLMHVCALVRLLWKTPTAEWPTVAGHEVVRGVVILLWKKKGDRASLDNYRGICLLSIISRIVARIVATRLGTWSEAAGFMDPEQFGFRPRRSTRDEILLARMLFEEASRGDSADALAMVLVLVDIKKAYPNVPRSLCWKVFRVLGVPESLVQVMTALHESTAYVVRTGSGDSEMYGLQRGLREGCPSSCQVYNIFHNVTLWALRKWLPTGGVPYLARPDAPLPRRKTEEAGSRGRSSASPPQSAGFCRRHSSSDS